MQYGADYQEDVHVNGQWLRFRLLRPADRSRVRAGFEHLSPDSRYLRFFAHKSSLSEEELDYLTDCDNWNHLAICAVALTTGGLERDGIAVARFIRLGPDHTTAEVALTVVDSHQGRGIGRMLLQHLLRAAHERGVVTMHFVILPENSRMRALLSKLGSKARIRGEDDVLVAELPVADVLAGQAPVAAGEPVDAVWRDLFRVLAEDLPAFPLTIGVLASTAIWRRVLS